MIDRAWWEISRDPNAPEVLAHRQATLAHARAGKLVENRIDYIRALATGKHVLDVGVVEHFRESSAADTWLHKHVREVAASALGIDILEAELHSLRERGFNVRTHDITKAPLSETFELIVVGDVIEHLNDPASLFRNAAAMLAPEGRLVITTPNPWYANAIMKNLLEGQPFTDSADHVAWFDPGTICELAHRSGLQLVAYSGVRAETSGTLLSRTFLRLTPLFILLGVRREVFAKTMIYEFSGKRSKR